MKKQYVRIALVLLSVQLSGCHYYKAGQVKTITPEYIVQKNQIRDYVIIHYNEEIFHMSGITASGNNVVGDKRELVPPHTSIIKDQYRTNAIKRYKRRDFVPTNEVHIYAKALETDGSKVSIDIGDIERIEVYDEAMGATIATYVGTATVITAAAGAIFLAIACSCPSVYTYDGEEYSFQGNAFPGAIGSSLERDDYLRLERPENRGGSVRIKLANEKPETEVFDLTELISVQHPPTTEVLFSRQGQVLAYSELELPLGAVNGSSSKLEVIARRDANFETFTDNSSDNGMNALVLSFDKPTGVSEGNLLLAAKNSKWMDYVFIDFFHQFGDYYGRFKKQQSTKSAVDRISWLKEQGVLLNVYIEIGGEWRYYDYFNVVGSVASRDIGMHLKGLDPGSGQIRVKLESGFGFWEVDYAAMDFGTDDAVVELKSAPSKAVGADGEEVLELLSAADGLHLSDISMGETLLLEFEPPSEQAGMATTHFLHSRGYYEMDLTIEGKARLSYLKTFRKAGRFSRLSKELFQQMNAPTLVTKPN